MMTSIFIDMGLLPSIHDLCLHQGIPSSKESPSDPTDMPLHLGMSVDDFVYYSDDNLVERHFESLLAAKIEVKFMGTVNWFLGTHFE